MSIIGTKLDPVLQAGINYLTHLSARSSYNVYAFDVHGRRLIGSHAVQEPAYMHTFGMTEHYVILVEYPLVVNPLSILLSGKPFIENKDHVALQERRMERTKRRLMMKSNDSTPFVTPSAIEGIITKLSPFSVEETLERLQEAIQSRNLSLFAHIDHSGEAKRVGLTMQEAHVLIFGSPKAGTPLMIASPLLALDLPLKVLVWQGNDGHVWVSYTSIAYLTVRYSIPQDLTRNIAGIDGLIESVLRS